MHLILLRHWKNGKLDYLTFDKDNEPKAFALYKDNVESSLFISVELRLLDEQVGILGESAFEQIEMSRALRQEKEETLAYLVIVADASSEQLKAYGYHSYEEALRKTIERHRKAVKKILRD